MPSQLSIANELFLNTDSQCSALYGAGDGQGKTWGWGREGRRVYNRLIRHSKNHYILLDDFKVSVHDCKVEGHWFELQMLFYFVLLFLSTIEKEELYVPLNQVMMMFYPIT